MWEGKRPESKDLEQAPGVNDLREGKESDELALHGVHYGFKPVVSPQLLIDAVKVVTQSLEADLQALGDLRRVFSGRE
jgi:hypothetical protein